MQVYFDICTGTSNVLKSCTGHFSGDQPSRELSYLFLIRFFNLKSIGS